MKEYAARVGKEKIHTGVWWRKTSGKDSLEDRHVDLVVMLKCIVKKLGGWMWTGLIWLRIGADGRLLLTR